MKIFTKGLTIVLSFFLLWWAFATINWISLFQLEEIGSKSEKKLGDLFWHSIKGSEKEIKNISVVNSLDTIVNRICAGSEIDRNSMNVHILKSDDVNAFALPGGHLVVMSALITDASSPEALAGVVSHEIAHIQLKHVSQKLVKELGVSTIAGMVSSGSGAEMIKRAMAVVTSTAFDRKLEKEADLKAVDFMVKAKINPIPFSELMDQFAEGESESIAGFSWLSTHPDSKERALYIRTYADRKKGVSKTLLCSSTWEKLQNALE